MPLESAKVLLKSPGSGFVYIHSCENLASRRSEAQRKASAAAEEIHNAQACRAAGRHSQ
jgi:hypothetical protein